MKTLVPPPIVAFIAGVVIWYSNRLFPDLSIDFAGQSGVAILVASVGFFMELTGVVQFFRRRTTVNPLKPERATGLVTDGIYRFTRNPMYVGMMLLLTAWSIHLGAALPGLVFISLAVWFLTNFQIKPEEQALEALFGEDYVAYKTRVRRWI